jgi:Transglycosylase-like domain
MIITCLFIFALPAHADQAKKNAPTPDIEMQVARHAARYRQITAWVTAVDNYKKAIAYAAALEQQRYDAAQQAKVAAAVEHYSGTKNLSTPSSGRCGGNLPPCYVMNRESGGSLTAQNPTSTASGKWQFLDSTWNNYGGYSSASDAPENVQDAKAAEVWAGGAGCSHWSAC